MDSAFQKHVLPHGDIKPIVEGKLWVVEGSLSYPLPRNMVIYKMPGEGLLLTSVIALNQQTMEKLEALGKPTTFLVPNKYHTMDLAVYKRQYPQARLVCPAVDREAIEKKTGLRIDANAAMEFAAGSQTSYRAGTISHAVPGFGGWECYTFDLGDGHGVAAHFGDMLVNVNKPSSGLKERLLRRAFDIGGPMHVHRMGRWLFLKDRTSFQKWLREFPRSLGKPMTAAIPAHGDIVSGQGDVAAALSGAANRL